MNVRLLSLLEIKSSSRKENWTWIFDNKRQRKGPERARKREEKTTENRRKIVVGS